MMVLKVAVLGIVVMVSTGEAGDYEPEPTLRASEILPADLLGSEYHRVADEVVNDGYMNLYRIRSDFGEFPAYGGTMLALRVQEVRALGELAEISKTEVFLDAAGEAAMAPVKAAQQFADKPVETVKGIPGGVKRMFRSVKRDVKEVKEAAEDARADDEEDEEGEGSEDGDDKTDKAVDATSAYAKKYFGITGAERRWAEKLSVDPYSSNEVLRKEIKGVAKVDAAAGFATKLAVPRIPGLGTVATVTSMVWSIDPRELREQNLARLQNAGISAELIESFLDQPWYSPTLQTFLVTALVEMEAVDNLSPALELALDAESEEEAVFFVRTVRMLADIHRTQGVEALATGTSLPGALTADNRLIFALPTDHIAWTEEVAADANRVLPELARGYESRGREIWLHGTASARCREELGGLGWKVRTEVSQSGESGES
jgi:hypothetical protein